jgi:hypothetical protein
MKANLNQIDRTIRLIMGAVLLAISFVFPLITNDTGKIIVSVVGVILVVTGATRY